jgi:thiamine kinase-like enzyme
VKGSSGATLDFSGDFIRKKCKDAGEQCEWFRIASRYTLAPSVRFPQTISVSDSEYDIEFIEGVCGTQVESTRLIDTLVDQVSLWSKIPASRHADWESYKERLRSEHVSLADSEIVCRTFDFLDEIEPLPSSFSHGDLTLENIIVENNGGIVLIDPNFKKNLFQSYVLDLGKLLQSVHSDYHRLFNSHPGGDPAPLCAHLRQRLGEPVWTQALAAEISHVVRLRKYRPSAQWLTVDRLLEKLLAEAQGC